MTRARQVHRKSGSVWLVWLCALSLLAFQGLGHWHRIAHGASLRGSPVAQTITSPDIWGHSSGDTDCRLFDQLSHGDGLSAKAIELCAQVHALVPDAATPVDINTAARWKRGARGPPISV